MLPFWIVLISPAYWYLSPNVSSVINLSCNSHIRAASAMKAIQEILVSELRQTLITKSFLSSFLEQLEAIMWCMTSRVVDSRIISTLRRPGIRYICVSYIVTGGKDSSR